MKSAASKYKKVVSNAPVLSGYNPPSHIKFLTDSTEAEFEGVSLRSTHRAYDLYIYRYTKSNTKLGMPLPMKKEDLEYLSKKDYVIFDYDSTGKQIKVSTSADY
jgi:hypothetical protein